MKIQEFEISSDDSLVRRKQDSIQVGNILLEGNRYVRHCRIWNLPVNNNNNNKKINLRLAWRKIN